MEAHRLAADIWNTADMSRFFPAVENRTTLQPGLSQTVHESCGKKFKTSLFNDHGKIDASQINLRSWVNNQMQVHNI